MKRRMNTLASSTGKASKKRSWQEEDSDDDEEDDAPARAADSDSDEDRKPSALGEKSKSANQSAGPNPVVWMDIVVAGTARGRFYFELFKDVAPQAAENFRILCKDNGPYKGSEFFTVTTGHFTEGGDIDPPDDLPPVVASGSQLRHTKGGLLSAPTSISLGDASFRLTFAAMPELDAKRVVFGQLVGPKSESSELHPLHWIEAVGTISGTPREEVIVDACGECDDSEADAVLGAAVRGAMVDGLSETQDERYSRAGVTYGRLADAVSNANLANALELTEDLLFHLEYKMKHTKTAADKAAKMRELESAVKLLADNMEDIAHKAGDVKGFENKLGSKAKSQVSRIEDLGKSLNRQY